MFFSHYFAKFKVNSSTIGKTLILHNVIILIKKVLKKDKNKDNYEIFLEQCSNRFAQK